jgi:predicted ArsR family transcriptional regulator
MQSTRSKIMDFLDNNNQATAVELSQVLGMTQANIRYHLSVLIEEGKVEVVGQNQTMGRGRPTHLYMPTKQAQKHSLDVLLRILLDDIHSIGSSRQRESKIKRLADRLSSPRVEDNKSIAIRLGECIRHLNDLHYQAHWEARSDFPVILFRRCPYSPVIDQYPELCTMDKHILENLLNREVTHTEKITRLPNSPQQCRFAIQDRKRGLS